MLPAPTFDTGIFDVAVFEDFLNKKIKVDGKPGALGDAVAINKDKKYAPDSQACELLPRELVNDFRENSQASL